MSAWKLIYLIFRRVVTATSVFLCLMTVSACSDSTQSANEKGALAQSQLDAGQLADARKTIAKAVAERDDIPELQLLRARIEMQANSPATAYSAYSAALALDSTNMEALTGVANLGLQLGHISESEDATNRMLALDPKQPNGLLLKGLHDVIKRRFEDAVKDAEAILAGAPTDENAAILKARSLAMLGRNDEAFQVVQGIRKTAGDTPGVTMTLLELYRYRGDGAAMVPLQERLRQLSPDKVSVDIDEADTLYKLGSAARARGILYSRMLDPKTDADDAESIVRLWQEYDPEPLDAGALAQVAARAGLPARMALARHYLQRGDSARADAVLSGAPATDDVTALRARAGAMQGRLDESLGAVNAILARDHTHCGALLARAQIEIAKRQLDKAVADGTLATTTCPHMPVAFTTLAQAQDALGNKQGAMIALRDGFDRNDQDAWLVGTYVTWLESRGQGTQALAVARRLTSNAPSLLSGWKLYGQLCGRVSGANCTSDAQDGLARAQHRFGVDPRSDSPPLHDLFGRLETQ